MAVISNVGRISDILLRRKAIEPEALSGAEKQADAEGVRLEKYLVSKKIVKIEDMTLAFSEYLHMPPINLAAFNMPGETVLSMVRQKKSDDDDLKKQLKQSRADMDETMLEMLGKRLLLPIGKVGKRLTVAVGDPFDLMAIDELSSMTGLSITPLVASEDDIKATFGRLFKKSNVDGLDMKELMKTDGDVEVLDEQQEGQQSLDEMLQSAEGAPVIRMVNMMLVEAIRTGASDIHIEPMEKRVRLRYRIDGKLEERPGPPKNFQNAVISRIKIMSSLNIAERRVPQDGRFNIKALGKAIDLRVSILPTVHGEKIVMRTLDKTKLVGSLSKLGLDSVSEKAMGYAIAQPNGMILVTGPTGSGKTTTLYSCLQDMNKPDTNIITVEDPVEYQLEGINQVHINHEVGMTFAAALRSILRQDPNVILVGEIRDGETAHIAVEAALTGHLVLSTLHTNDAPSAVTRLTDMGIEPFLMGSCLVLAQAQRLYRKLCPACKKATKDVDAEVLHMNHIEPDFFNGVTLYEPVGCPRCVRGFKGRGSIMEVLLVNDEVRAAIIRGANTAELREIACKNGMLTLKQAGLHRVREGVTALLSILEETGGG